MAREADPRTALLLQDARHRHWLIQHHRALQSTTEPIWVQFVLLAHDGYGWAVDQGT